MNSATIIDQFDAITLNAPEPAPAGRRASAVLVPIIYHEGQLRLILTMRSSTLRHHAGQISFPGGRLDDGETVVQAALRESQEEIGLHPDLVQIRGFLPGVITTANFHIAPVLGLIDHIPDLNPAPDEVERILIEPLAPLLDRQNHGREAKEYQGQPYQTWVIDHPSEYIWGATAKMLVQWSRAMLGQGTEDHHDRVHLNR